MKVVHCKKEKYDVYIGRGSKWGNPFEIGKDGTRDGVIAKYREWIVKQPELMYSLDELRGKTLGCWCSPKPCHGDVLIKLIQKRFTDPDIFDKRNIKKLREFRKMDKELSGETISSDEKVKLDLFIKQLIKIQEESRCYEYGKENKT